MFFADFIVSRNPRNVSSKPGSALEILVNIIRQVSYKTYYELRVAFTVNLTLGQMHLSLSVP